ncbi:unnamed protein product [Arctogadus glacialis]
MADDRCTTGLLSLNLCGTNTDGAEVEFAKGMQEFKVKDQDAADKDWRGCVLEVDPSAEPWAPGSQLGTMMKQEGDDASHWGREGWGRGEWGGEMTFDGTLLR